MKNLIRTIIVSWAILSGVEAFAYPTHTKEVSTMKKNIYTAFSDTSIEGRLVDVKLRHLKADKVSIKVVWHPRKVEDILDDMLIILQTINKVVPNFSSVSLRAVHPDYMRWSKYILWEAFVTKKAFILLQQNQLQKHGDREPQPLY